MSEEVARTTFASLRWADNGGKPYCPKCGCVEIYSYASRPIFKCKACRAQFSVTSGTIFADRKMAVRDILLAIAIFVNGAKGHSALQLSRDLDCQYKTAFVLAHKIRESMASETADMTIGGEGKAAEIDGAYFGGHSAPANKAADRKDRRRKSVVVARERGGRTLTTVVGKESEGVKFIRERLLSGTVVHADEAAGWEVLHGSYDMRRINHSVAYSLDGACTNQAESFFSRLRRAEIGTHHHLSGRYLAFYASEMAWREDYRRASNGDQFKAVATLAGRHPVSRVWAGYWQRNAA
jgi:transposase-like protein